MAGSRSATPRPTSPGYASCSAGSPTRHRSRARSPSSGPGWGATALAGSVAELERVLRPNGVLLLAECTNPKPDLAYWHYRPVDEYVGMFASVDLTVRGQYMELDNTVSVLAGRRAAE